MYKWNLMANAVFTKYPIFCFTDKINPSVIIFKELYYNPVLKKLL